MCEFTRYAFLIEPQMLQVNGNIHIDSVSDESLLLMSQYLTEKSYSVDNNNNNNNVVATQSGFAIRLPNYGKIIISVPMWKNCTINPLHDPLFVIGEPWSIDLQSDGCLAIGLPEVNGERKKFVFSECIWRSWVNDTESSKGSNSIQNKSANVSINNSLSLMDINTSDIVKSLGDDEVLAAFVSMDWFSDSLINFSIGAIEAITSICGNIQPNVNIASIEVSLI